MEDQNIIALYFARKEQAIQETDRKYGSYCYSIANGILRDTEDSKETVSDTYMAAWKAIPPERPRILKAFLGRITRNLSLNRWTAQNAQRRGKGEIPMALEELSECLSAGPTTEETYDAMELRQALKEFVSGLPGAEKQIFLCRYWYLESNSQIAKRFGYSESKVGTTLCRTRKKLKKYLMQEGLL